MESIDRKLIVAPGRLHLPLYEEIINQTGGGLMRDVVTLDTWISRHLKTPPQPRIALLYQYQQALQDLSPENDYYASRQDYDFLSALLEFMEMVQLNNITQFPSATKRKRTCWKSLKNCRPSICGRKKRPPWISRRRRTPPFCAQAIRPNRNGGLTTC